jgi:hypothetical protein
MLSGSLNKTWPFDSLRPLKLTYFDDFRGLKLSKRLCFISGAGKHQKGAISGQESIKKVE